MLAVQTRQGSQMCDVQVVLLIGKVPIDFPATDQISIHKHAVLLVASDEAAPNVALVVVNKTIYFFVMGLLD